MPSIHVSRFVIYHEFSNKRFGTYCRFYELRIAEGCPHNCRYCWLRTYSRIRRECRYVSYVRYVDELVRDLEKA